MIPNSFFEELQKNGIEYRENEIMQQHTSFKIGGAADVFISIKSADQLRSVLLSINKYEIPMFILGHGSNILVSDSGIEGAVISLEALNEITVEGNTITAGAGALLSLVCKSAQCASLSGLEFAYGIPASVGGALYMNAGAYGGEMADVVVSACCIDREGNIKTLEAKDLALGYRTSIFKQNGLIILSVCFSLKCGDGQKILADMEDFLSRRKSKQPLEFPSAGSTFKRPVGYFAGALIEQNGLKGFSVGGAQVSEKHAGFVINRGGATARDVRTLMNEVRKKVLESDGVELHPEVIFVGREEED